MFGNIAHERLNSTDGDAEILLTEVSWYEGSPLDLLIYPVDDEGERMALDNLNKVVSIGKKRYSKSRWTHNQVLNLPSNLVEVWMVCGHLSLFHG